MALSNAPKCPSCGKRQGVRKFIFGMPVAMPDETKYVVGGCVISAEDDDPEWKCLTCGLEWHVENVIRTPVGRIAWRGQLEETGMLTMPDGQRSRFYSLISMTNGACFEWFFDSEH